MSAILTLNSEVNELRDRLDAAERDAARAWAVVDRLCALHRCASCGADGGPCGDCDGTGVASPPPETEITPELVAMGARMIG